MADVKLPFSHVIEGGRFPGMFSEENIRSAISYKPQSDDIFLVTYPKCGTTWTQQVMILILRKGIPVTSETEMFASCPFLEIEGGDAAQNMPRPGVLTTHFHFHLIPHSTEAKYVYVTRNPKDCCVSFFHQMTNLPGHKYNASFDEFLEMFMSGELDFGDYFDHVLKWYEHRNDSNVLFLTYEEMKVDAKATVMKIASFLGEEYANPLRENPKIWDDIVRYSSFDYMKVKVSDQYNQVSNMDEETLQNDPILPKGMKHVFSEMNAKKGEIDKIGNLLVRKGIVGDWRNHFSPEQNKRMDAKIAEKLKGTALMDLWKDYL